MKFSWTVAFFTAWLYCRYQHEGVWGAVAGVISAGILWLVVEAISWVCARWTIVRREAA